MLIKLKQEGKGASVPNTPIELAIIYKSFNLDVPTDLHNKVFVGLMLFHCNRDQENLRKLKKTYITFHVSDDKQIYSSTRSFNNKKPP